MAARMAMIATTTSSSIKVKPCARVMSCPCSLVIVQFSPRASAPDRVIDLQCAAAGEVEARRQQAAAADHGSHRHGATGGGVVDEAAHHPIHAGAGPGRVARSAET